jgi:hypothetical protein
MTDATQALFNPQVEGDEEGVAGDDLVLDLTDVDESKPEYEPLPPGTYPATVQRVEYGQSQSSGNPMLTWVFAVPQQPADGELEGEPQGDKLLFYFTVLNKDTGKQRLKRALMTIAPDIDLSNFKPAEAGDWLEGRPCQLKVRVRRNQGRIQNDITDILPAEEAAAFL